MTRSVITIIIVAIAVFFASCSNPAMPMVDGKAALSNDESTKAVTEPDKAAAEQDFSETFPVDADEKVTDEPAAQIGENTPRIEGNSEAEVEAEVEADVDADADSETPTEPAADMETGTAADTDAEITDGLNSGDNDAKDRGKDKNKGKDNNNGNQYGLYK